MNKFYLYLIKLNLLPADGTIATLALCAEARATEDFIRLLELLVLLYPSFLSRYCLFLLSLSP